MTVHLANNRSQLGDAKGVDYIIPLGEISTLEKYKRNNDMMWVNGKGLGTTICNKEIKRYDRSSMGGYTVTAWKQ